ncbi:alpha-ketoglutarate dehydrogenase component 4-like [Liolophura sinensis]|uniref:alpha-ketoglutarate dehydrogenase component 4-like n=1 Tax=Liolophura sinensis TaxID=3198878 RepID=UPI0031585E3D
MMAANGARAIRAVKPHVPLIKFPQRKGPDGKKIDGRNGTAAASSSSSSSSSSNPSTSSSKPIGSTPRGSGIDSIDLPSRYRRKPLTEEEMEFIERGGAL